MNKYQEALELLKEDHISNELNTVDKINHNARLGKIIDLLQELVDKATSFTPEDIDNFQGFESGVCKCGSIVSEHESYCPDCGQRLSWGEKKWE